MMKGLLAVQPDNNKDSANFLREPSGSPKGEFRRTFFKKRGPLGDTFVLKGDHFYKICLMPNGSPNTLGDPIHTLNNICNES